jgi:hypothetical protein
MDCRSSIDGMTTDPRAFAAAWRPQYPGRREAKAVVDPIIEPDWAGLRVVAAIEGGVAEVYRYGDRLDVPASLEEALGNAFEAEDGVIEGHLTKQAFDTGVGAYPAAEHVTRPIFSLPRFLRRDNRDPFIIGRRHQAEEEGRALEIIEALAAGEDHAFVAVDLLWLDGQDLTGIPLQERKRQLDAVLAQSRLVRVTPWTRPGGSRLAGTWGTLGFEHVFWRAANSRYTPGRENPDWVVVSAPQAQARVPNAEPTSDGGANA